MCDYCKSPRKWSWTEFVLGKIKNQFIIWIVSTVLVFVAVFAAKDLISEKIRFTLVIVWGAISFCLFFYEALSKLIENGKLNVDVSAKAGINKEVKKGDST